MAVDSGSVSKHKERMKSPDKKNGNGIPSSPPKRNKSPRIRVVGARIYDSVNGKTCHQCRQKTRDFGAACKNQRKDKTCPIMYCHKCLLNRYGEKAEEVAALSEWSCPRCRGICNCSICMKKRGHQPTGILINMAKATGFASVSEMLLKGGDQVSSEETAVGIVTTPKKEVIVSPKKRGKENSFDGKADTNLPNSVDAKSKKVEERPEKRKANQEGFENVNDYNKDVRKPEEMGSHMLEKKPKKTKVDGSAEFNTGRNDKDLLNNTCVRDNEKKVKETRTDGLREKDDCEKQDGSLARRTSPRKLKVPSKMSNQEMQLKIEVDSGETIDHRLCVTCEDPVGTSDKDARTDEEDSETANGDDILEQYDAQILADFSLPAGQELTSVAGIDVRAEDVGNALQFLEFCAVFGKVLDIKKGQPDSVLRDLLHGRTGRRGKHSVTIQFHILLLSVIDNEQGEVAAKLSPRNGKNPWFSKLKECLSESQSVLEAQGLGSLDQVADYETLDASQKLRLLNLLCDEVLQTAKLRNWISDQSTKHSENVKEAKQKLLAAKNEEKSLKQKMKDDIAKAIIAKQGVPLSISEHEAIVSHIKSEANKAHAKVLESKGVFSKYGNQTSDALRTEPIFLGCNGCAYWKLNAYKKPELLCQNIGKGDTLTLDEKWSTVDAEGKEALEKHIGLLRRKRQRL